MVRFIRVFVKCSKKWLRKSYGAPTAVTGCGCGGGRSGGVGGSGGWSVVLYEVLFYNDEGLGRGNGSMCPKSGLRPECGTFIF